ncbi:MAG: hypothetical protein AAB413_01295 [Patescibacteria group bacterium]
MERSPQSREVAVTAERTHGGMTKRKGILTTVVGSLALGDVELASVEWTHKAAQNGRPEMWRGKVNGVEIWCKEVDPASFTDQIVGVLEVKLNQVSKDGDSQYMYVNVLPLGDATPTATVSIVRPAKTGEGKERRKVLPPDFDDSTDFSVDRQSQPWQVVTVRASAPTA